MKQEICKCIRYVQFQTNSGIGHGCFAIEFRRNGSNLAFSVGSAFCNAKDQFHKPLARKIATGRLTNNFQDGVVESNETGFLTDRDFKLMLNTILNDTASTTTPAWATKAFNRSKYTLTLRKQEAKVTLTNLLKNYRYGDVIIST